MDTFAVSLRRTNIFDKYRTIIEMGLINQVPLSQIDKMVVEACYSGARSNFTHISGALIETTLSIRNSSCGGVVERNINRLKTIKYQMYGRASIDLLKRKVILSISG